MFKASCHRGSQIFEQIAENYRELITSGAILPGELLPSWDDMAKRLSMNPHMVKRAYEILEQEGYIYFVSGKGAFVDEEEKWKQMEKQALFRSLEEMVKRGKKLCITQEEFKDRMEAFYREEA